jgi:hypothetical protein
MTTYPEITFGQMRDQGVRKVLVYCRHCTHHTVMNAGRWSDNCGCPMSSPS